MPQLIDLNITFDGAEFRVVGEYYRAIPGKMYLSNGDPGYPDDPAEFYIHHLYPKDSKVDVFEYMSEAVVDMIVCHVLELIEEDEREECEREFSEN